MLAYPTQGGDLCHSFASVASHSASNACAHLQVRNRTLYVNGEEYFVRGVNYNPFPKGWDGAMDESYEEFFGAQYSSTEFDWTTAKVLYTPDTIWEGMVNKFTGHPSYHDVHLRELRKTFNTIRVYRWPERLLLRFSVHGSEGGFRPRVSPVGVGTLHTPHCPLPPMSPAYPPRCTAYPPLSTA